VVALSIGSDAVDTPPTGCLGRRIEGLPEK
jgi:hypothetical protein